jgi:hypothetical protein
LRLVGLEFDRRWGRLAYFLFAILAMLVLLTFRDDGVTLDEVHFYYSFKVLDFSLSLGRDKSYLDFMNLYTYGAAFDVLTAALSRVSPMSSWETRHLVDRFHPWQPTAGGRTGTRRHARRRFFSTDS